MNFYLLINTSLVNACFIMQLTFLSMAGASPRLNQFLGKMASEISDVWLEQVNDSAYIKPVRMHFKQDGKEREWDCMKVHDSVAILLFHSGKNCFVFVKQFRPAVYMARVVKSKAELNDNVDWSKYPGSLGMTYELCAGIVDKELTLEEIAAEEIEEECGFRVPPEKLERITSMRSSIGTSSGSMTLYYAEIDDSMKVSEGGGNMKEQERIEVIYVPVEDGKKVLFDESIPKPAAFMFALMWFYNVKANTVITKCNDG